VILLLRLLPKNLPQKKLASSTSSTLSNSFISYESCDKWRFD
jgi:hypothetical protein